MRGQTMLETTILVVAVTAGILGMSIYLKRGVAGRLRQVTDQAGEQFSTSTFSATTNVSYQTTRQDRLQADGTTRSEISRQGGEVQNRRSVAPEHVGALADEPLF